MKDKSNMRIDARVFRRKPRTLTPDAGVYGAIDPQREWFWWLLHRTGTHVVAPPLSF